jgi:hypothetical protein
VDPVNEPNSPTFRLPRNVAVYGGFNGTETDFDDRDVTNNVTTLSGDVLGDDPNNPDDNVVRIVSIIRVSGVVLDGFTITGSGDAISDDAVFIEVADARIANCTFEGNEARSVTLSQSNSVTLRMDDCTFTGNSAESLFVAGGRILGLFRCSFTNNTEVPIQGGGTMTLIDCDFTGNQSGTAGAIDFRDASGTLDIWNSRFLSNGGSHGAIGGNESSVDYTVVNSLFAHNGPGGALQTLGSLTLDNCTFARNFHSSDNQPGGVSSAGPATVSNCIFWQNCNDAGDPNGCDPNSAGQGEQTNLAYDPNVVVVNYTCIQGLSAGFFGGTGNIGGTPSTTTMFVAPGPSNLDFHLDPNSPCIDAGDNARLPADVLDVDGDGNTSETLQIDLDRNSRIHNGTVDMGAFEFRVACGSGCGSGGGGDADFNDDCAVNITDLGIMLTNFGKVGAIHAEGDANLDGIINITDVGIALSLFGATCSP